MADKPTFEEVEKVLNNPDVSHSVKEELTRAYAAAYYGDGWTGVGLPDEIKPYLNRYNDGTFSTLGYKMHLGDSEVQLKEVYQKAKGQVADEKKEDTAHDKAIEEGRQTLQESKKAAQNGEHGGAGIGTSDEILDAGKGGLWFFFNFIPLYEKIKTAYRNKANVPKIQQIKDRYHEQRGIDFDKFAAEVNDLKAAEKAMNSAHQDMAARLGKLWDGWTGSASEASQDYYGGTFTPAVTEGAIRSVSDSIEITQETLRAVADVCRNKATTVLNRHKVLDQMAHRSTGEWDITIQVANGSLDDAILRQACAIWNAEINEESCGGDLSQDTKKKIIAECEKVTREKLAEPLENACIKFNDLCDKTKKGVDEAWGALNKELAKTDENPFVTTEKEQQQQKPPSGPQPPRGSGGSSAAGGGMPSGGGGAGGGGGTGGGMPPGGAAAMPPGGGAAMPPGGNSPAGTPQMPQSPQPDMPGAMQPGGPQTPGGPQQQRLDEVTLGEGENQVTVQEPDQQGNTEIKVIGEDGQPKTYEIAFGDQGGSGQQLSGQGPGAGPQTLPGQASAGGAAAPPAGGAQMPPGQPGGTGQPGGPAPASPMPGRSGESSTIPIDPGEDGTAVIHEGDRTITVERTPDGELQVSIDNGQGQPPTTQTVDFGDDSQQGTPPGAGGPQGFGPPGPGPQQPFIPPQAQQPAPATPFEQPPPAQSMPAGAPQETTGPTPAGAQTQANTSGYAQASAPDVGATTSAPSGAGQPGQPDQFDSSGQPPADPMSTPASTVPQSAGFNVMSGFEGAGMQNSFGSASGSLFTSAESGGGSQWGQPVGNAAGPQSGATGFSGMSEARSSSTQGATGFASMGAASGGAGGEEQSSSGMRGGMMPMSGMGGGGQQGGDEERSNDSPWRTEGQLFDDGIDSGAGFQYRAVLGEDTEK